MSGKSHSETSAVDIQRRGIVHVVTMTANDATLTNALREKLSATLSKLDDDAECRAIVLTADGDTFCAGSDEQETASPLAIDLFKRLAAGKRPVVAAVEGMAAGPGLSLVTACDYVVATTASHFSCAFGSQGGLPQGGLYWSLARRIGGGRARQALLEGRTFGGQEALDTGLANQLTGPGHALEKAIAVAARYAAMPPMAIALLKAVMASGTDTLDQAIETETDIQPLLRFSEDHNEAVQAFLQKRAPNFVGR